MIPVALSVVRINLGSVCGQDEHSLILERISRTIEMSTNQSKCPIDITVGILSHKWASQIIRELFSGPKRPSQLYRSLKPISSKTLTQRLKMLQDQGIVDKVDKEGPARHTQYSLTEMGRELESVLEVLVAYGKKWKSNLGSEELDETARICNSCPTEGHDERCPAIAVSLAAHS